MNNFKALQTSASAYQLNDIPKTGLAPSRFSNRSRGYIENFYEVDDKPPKTLNKNASAAQGMILDNF